MVNEQIFLAQLKSLIEDDIYDITTLSNMSALINQHYDNINWVGFYITDDQNNLYLGPFQGKTACTYIKYGNGVCGSALKHQRTFRVENVHEFEGHIACDSASNSEIVIPIFVNDKVYGVLDIDSPLLNRFSEEDEKVLSKAVKILEDKLSK